MAFEWRAYPCSLIHVSSKAPKCMSIGKVSTSKRVIRRGRERETEWTCGIVENSDIQTWPIRVLLTCVYVSEIAIFGHPNYPDTWTRGKPLENLSKFSISISFDSIRKCSSHISVGKICRTSVRGHMFTSCLPFDVPQISNSLSRIFTYWRTKRPRLRATWIQNPIAILQ